MAVTDFKAAQKWAKIPKSIQKCIIENVYCSLYPLDFILTIIKGFKVYLYLAEIMLE